MKKVFLTALLTTMLTACGTGTVIGQDGLTDQARWHKWDKVIFNKDRGTFPDLTSLREVKSGMTKDQLYYLLGRPQYHDGWRPNEWNYLFHFHTKGQGTDNVTTCQFKVTFDKNNFARGFYWNPVDPDNADSNVVCGFAGKELQRYTLSEKVYFVFDKDRRDEINQGRREVEEVAAKISQFDDLTSIQVLGFTDRMGSDEYNAALSTRRAETVRQYLIDLGLPAALIHAEGRGKSFEMQCDDSLPRTEKIACLQKDRHAQIIVNGSGLVSQTGAQSGAKATEIVEGSVIQP